MRIVFSLMTALALLPGMICAQSNNRGGASFDLVVNKYNRQRIYAYVKNASDTPLLLNSEEVYINGDKLKTNGGAKDAIWYDICRLIFLL